LLGAIEDITDEDEYNEVLNEIIWFAVVSAQERVST
jgi:hypothetical protein